MPESNSAKLLKFIVPGYLHGMGNALFTIQAHAQVANADPMIARGCAKAANVLDVLRRLSDPETDDDSGPVGPQLRTVVELMRVSMPDSGMTIDAADDVFEATDAVPLGEFVRTVVLTTLELHETLPTGCKGSVRIVWIEPGVLRIGFDPDPSQLPFDVDLTAAQERLGAAVADTAFRVRCQDPGHGLVVSLPLDGGPRV
jgi:hypothetical protein